MLTIGVWICAIMLYQLQWELGTIRKILQKLGN